MDGDMDGSSGDRPSICPEERAGHEAAVWFARLLDEQSPKSDYAHFRAWLQADEENARAYARLERLWSQAGAEPIKAEGAPTRRAFLKSASGAVVLIGAGGVVWSISGRSDFSTGTGEIRTVTLPDGTRVELAAASAISLDFTASIRRILLHRGEAFFAVAPDAGRPFVVDAGMLTATALGTAFSVAIAPERTSVAVTEHDVRVEADGLSIDLAEGDAIDWENGALGAVAKGEANGRLGWRSRQLVFLARPLGEVLAEINRWRRGRLLVFDRELARRRVTAIIDLDDIAGIDASLEQGLPITLSSYASFLTVVSARK